MAPGLLDASKSLAVDGLSRCFLCTVSRTIKDPSSLAQTRSLVYPSPIDRPTSLTLHSIALMSSLWSSFSANLNWISLKARNIPRHFPILFLIVLLLALSFLMLSP